MTDFDKVAYWRKRTIEKLDSHMGYVQSIIVDIEDTFKHAEGAIPDDIAILERNLVSVYSNIRGVVMMMGKPKKEVHEKKANNKSDQEPQSPQGEKQIQTSGGNKTDGGDGSDSAGHSTSQVSTS